MEVLYFFAWLGFAIIGFFLSLCVVRYIWFYIYDWAKSFYEDHSGKIKLSLAIALFLGPGICIELYDAFNK